MSARASATRCRWPPDSCAGRRSPCAPSCTSSSISRARCSRSRLRDAAHPRAVRDVLQHRHVREQRVVLEDRVDVALVRRHATKRPRRRAAPARGPARRNPPPAAGRRSCPSPKGPAWRRTRRARSRTTRRRPRARRRRRARRRGTRSPPSSAAAAGRYLPADDRRRSRVTQRLYGTQPSTCDAHLASGVRQNLILSKFSMPLVLQPSAPNNSLPSQAFGTTGFEPNHAATSPCTFGEIDHSSHL